MTKLPRLLAVAPLLLVAGLGAACSSGGTDKVVLGSASTSPSTAEAETIATADNSALGTILVDEDGKTLYYFLKDKTSKSTCTGSCANVWPPVLTTGTPKAEGSAMGTLLGVTARDDGTSQVTYDGHPLYYYVADKAAGDAKGQDLDSFGADWYAVTPDGKKAGGAASDDDADATATPSPGPSASDDGTYRY